MPDDIDRELSDLFKAGPLASTDDEAPLDIEDELLALKVKRIHGMFDESDEHYRKILEFIGEGIDRADRFLAREGYDMGRLRPRKR